MHQQLLLIQLLIRQVLLLLGPAFSLPVHLLHQLLLVQLLLRIDVTWLPFCVYHCFLFLFILCLSWLGDLSYIILVSVLFTALCDFFVLRHCLIMTLICCHWVRPNL